MKRLCANQRIDHAAAERLAICLLRDVRSHLQEADRPGPADVYTALAAIAYTAASVIAATQSKRGHVWDWFDAALDQHMADILEPQS